MWSRVKKLLKKLNNTLSSEPKVDVPNPKAESKQPTMRTCIHEAGHYMVARIFPEKIKINELNANSSELVEDMNGALNITDIGFETLDSCDHIMLTAAGGLVANTINSRGKDYVENNLKKFPYNLAGLDRHGIGGDYELIQEFALKIAVYWRLTKNGYVKVQWNAIQFVFCYLMEEAVWETLLMLAHALHIKENYKLSPSEAEAVISLSPHLNGLGDVTKQYLSDRYPLTKDKALKLL